MNFAKAYSWTWSRALFWFLMAYWAVFIGYTVENFATGGPREVVAWYKHISYRRTSSFHWDWRVFALEQISLVLITVALWHFSRPKAD